MDLAARLPDLAVAAALAWGAGLRAYAVIFLAGVHLAKAGTRAAINTSPEPFSNWTASLAEDAMVPAGLWLAFAHPAVFFVLLAVFIVAAALLVRLIWRGLRSLLRA